MKPSVKGGHMKGRVLISTAGLKDPSCCCVWIENINTVQHHVTDLCVCVCVYWVFIAHVHWCKLWMKPSRAGSCVGSRRFLRRIATRFRRWGSSLRFPLIVPCYHSLLSWLVEVSGWNESRALKFSVPLLTSPNWFLKERFKLGQYTESCPLVRIFCVRSCGVSLESEMILIDWLMLI